MKGCFPFIHSVRSSMAVVPVQRNPFICPSDNLTPFQIGNMFFFNSGWWYRCFRDESRLARMINRRRKLKGYQKK